MKIKQKLKLKDLQEKEFTHLKRLGMLWEFYPDAPEFWNQIGDK